MSIIDAARIKRAEVATNNALALVNRHSDEIAELQARVATLERFLADAAKRPPLALRKGASPDG